MKKVLMIMSFICFFIIFNMVHGYQSAYGSNQNSDEKIAVSNISQTKIDESINPDTQSIMAYFINEKHWTKDQAAAVAANLFSESNYKHKLFGDHKKAYGIAQWHSERQAAFAALFKKNIRNSSLKEQLDFIDYELRKGSEKRAGCALKNAKTAKVAARVVSKMYLRPKAINYESEKRAVLAHEFAHTVEISYKIASN
jgi:hypothetical protein